MEWIRNPKEFWTGAMFIAFGVAAIVISSGYTMGIAERMGPGYFPRALGALLVVIGCVVGVRGLRVNGPGIAPFFLRPLIFVLGTVVVFGIVLPYTGVILGTLLLIVVTSFASHEFHPKVALVSGAILAVAAVLVFIVGLKLQLPVWPWPWNY